ncbi:Na+/H+ antiporter subunit B [Balneolaceae bacterium ANBcel3]|nr:Na+/H+ antiporter subunit B [Balneolaceae bacterium ANBcel3]
MKSLILHTTTRLMMAVLVLFSIFLFFRGHDEPGGGFIGGLVGAGAFTLYAIAFGTEATRKILKVHPITLIAYGLLSLVISGIIPFFTGEPFLTGKWLMMEIGGSEIKLSSPLIFDIGVFLCVVGFIVAVIFALEEEELPANTNH